MNEQMKNKEGLEALLKALVEKQQQKTNKKLSTTSSSSTKQQNQKVQQFINTLSNAQSVSIKERKKYLYPPITPEDIVQSIQFGIKEGIFDVEADSIVAGLSDANEIRKMIELGRMDASELPLLKYRIDKLLGLTEKSTVPDGREMLSSLAFYYRHSKERLNQIRAEALNDIQDDYQRNIITSEEFIRYSQEVNQIINQYIEI